MIIYVKIELPKCYDDLHPEDTKELIINEIAKGLNIEKKDILIDKIALSKKQLCGATAVNKD